MGHQASWMVLLPDDQAAHEDLVGTNFQEEPGGTLLGYMVLSNGKNGRTPVNIISVSYVPFIIKLPVTNISLFLIIAL